VYNNNIVVVVVNLDIKVILSQEKLQGHCVEKRKINQIWYTLTIMIIVRTRTR